MPSDVSTTNDYIDYRQVWNQFITKSGVLKLAAKLYGLKKSIEIVQNRHKTKIN